MKLNTQAILAKWFTVGQGDTIVRYLRLHNGSLYRQENNDLIAVTDSVETEPLEYLFHLQESRDKQ